ncbi:MAG TPA: bifunctional (p)ppGpp synthetase/guanosine-3',5'-bis(diphosphate) 3'-pyrophosphohydrolase [Jatrophihabitantaceae bacterium]|nr:bifunctional (p)ppGpp synthetase/guanosine-3',5'-bis(diphosphate) 3'-pyrophosphohydrolase [Jatrophihabitantaceae bacterium]
MTEPPVARTGVGRHSAATVDDAAQRSAPPPPPVLAAAQVPAVSRSGQQHRRRVRDRLARRIVTGTQRSSTVRPVLEPLLAIHRGAHPKIDARLLQRGYDLAEERHRGQRRKSGDPYITHPLAVATILAELGMDTITLVAALLHDTVEDTGLTVEEVAAEFGPEVAHLVDGVTKLDKVKFGEAAEAETIRKMIVAMARDPRVLVIKLADRLHNMRTLRFLPPAKQERKARETLEVMAPLAHRLGMNTVKWELEDLAFATLYPKRYDEIVRLVAERAPSRDTYLHEVIERISSDLREGDIKASLTGRPKHYYSIYQKMIVRGREFTDIYDLVGIRVLVDSERDCYAALGVTHANWQPVPGRFKDYIAMPKFNMYQSLHTTVIGPGGKPVELQIRTQAMHRTAEYGIAAHWKYKEQKHISAAEPSAVSDEMGWLRQLLEWQRELQEPEEFLDSLRYDLGLSEVYVFTPKGDVIALPAGSTPVDFAYAVHTEIGHRCIGARVNGKLVALESVLDNGETVEVFTSKAENAGPSRDWLGFVKSPRARTKIRQWFARERREDAIDAGKTALTRAMRKAALPMQRLLSGDALLTIARDLHMTDVAALYAAVGEGHISAQSVVQKLVAQLGGLEGATEDIAETARPSVQSVPTGRRASGDAGVVVKGATDVWVKLARCCTPVPGDDILGFVTRGGGVSVHRRACTNAAALLGQQDRLVDVEWAPSADSVFVVSIQVEALDRHRLLSDVSRVLSDERVNILSAVVTTNRDRVAVSKFTFELAEAKHLGYLLRAIRNVEGVYDVYRIHSVT